MVAKYLIAGTLSAILAGGAVWIAADAAERHPHAETHVKDNTKSVADKPVDAVIAEGSPETEGPRSYAEGDTNPSQSSQVIDRLVVGATGEDDDPTAEDLIISNASQTLAMADTVRAPEAQTEDRRSDSGIDAAPNEEETPTMAKAIETVMVNSEAKGTSTFVIAPKPEDAAGFVEPEFETDLVAPAEVVLVDPETAPVTPSPEASVTVPNYEAVASDETAEETIAEIENAPNVAASETAPIYDLLIVEAEKIDIIEARDDAYFNIIDYALMQGDFDQASALVASLSTEELRDTARQNSGIALAQAGRMTEAFAIVETLEIPALTDPIRAAIIRAATDTQR